MDAQFVSLVAFVLAAGAALIAIRRQDGSGADSRVKELEAEVHRLTMKVQAQELQIDNLLEQLNQQREYMRQITGENAAKSAANERLLKRLVGEQ